MEKSPQIILEYIEDEDAPKPWELDTTPEQHGLSFFEVCDAYIGYLYYGADSAGDMSEAEIALCDHFAKSWRMVDTAKCVDGTPYTDPFNTSPALSLDGKPCRTEGIWCAPVRKETAA